MRCVGGTWRVFWFLVGWIFFFFFLFNILCCVVLVFGLPCMYVCMCMYTILILYYTSMYMYGCGNADTGGERVMARKKRSGWMMIMMMMWTREL